MITQKPTSIMTPLQALAEYRKQSKPEMLEQVELFNKLGLADRLELVFFMLQHQAISLNMLGEIVAANFGKLERTPTQ